ncbi:hypothetical protein CPB86DRAFT_849135 [Serendipita vermifera]|nr:hypothetical protein CPB86DRAFT_849135 [Serendipita vermifera]
MSSSDAEAALQQLGVTQEQYIDFKDQQQTGRRLLHACLALLLWDYILTFKDEVDDVWKRAPRFSLAKVLFALNRYYPIITYLVRVIIFNMEVMTPIFFHCRCKVWIPFTGWSGTLNFVIVEVVLFLRVWALYDKSKKVGIFLILLFLSAIAVTFALRRLHPDGLGLAPLPPASLLVCKRSTAEEYFFLYFIAMLVETIVFGMLINKAWASSLGRHETPLINALLRHGTAYYAAVLCASSKLYLRGKLIIFQPVADSNLIVAIASIACNRLILSLRGFYFQRGVVTTNVTTFMTSPSFGGED